MAMLDRLEKNLPFAKVKTPIRLPFPFVSEQKQARGKRSTEKGTLLDLRAIIAGLLPRSIIEASEGLEGIPPLALS